jgi:hypothetical protein
LWHGVSAGILKTVPKYVTAIVVKDFMEEHLPHGDSKDKVTKLHPQISSKLIDGSNILSLTSILSTT